MPIRGRPSFQPGGDAAKLPPAIIRAAVGVLPGDQIEPVGQVKQELRKAPSGEAAGIHVQIVEFGDKRGAVEGGEPLYMTNKVSQHLCGPELTQNAHELARPKVPAQRQEQATQHVQSTAKHTSSTATMLLDLLLPGDGLFPHPQAPEEA